MTKEEDEELRRRCAHIAAMVANECRESCDKATEPDEKNAHNHAAKMCDFVGTVIMRFTGKQMPSVTRELFYNGE